MLEDDGIARRRAADVGSNDRCYAGASAIAGAELPAVVVDQPSRPAARSRPAPAGRPPQRQAGAPRQRGTTAPMPPAAAGARAETATGPVRGYLANQSGTGTKTDTPLRETPQSITVVTADRITDQGALTVQESLRYVPGVFADAYGPDSRGDYPRIRGQDPNIYLDGTRVVNTCSFNEWRPDPYTLERIEVLRGPASVLYGDTSTAGLLNLISKRPQAESSNEIGVQFGSFNRKQVQMDSTGKLTKDGEWLYRFIGVFRDSGTQTDYVPDDRIVLAPSLTWRPTNNTSWTVLGTYQKDKTGSSTAFLPHEGTLYPGPNGFIPVRRFAGEPGFDKYQTETGTICSLFEHSFSDGLKIRQNMRYAHVEGIYRTMYPNLNFVDPQSDNPNFPFLDPSRRTVARDIWSRETVKDSFTSDSNAELKLLTGPVAHKLLFGADYRELRERAQSGFDTDPTPFDLYAPVYSGVTPPALSPEPDLRQTQLGLYAQDQMRLGPWLAIVGLRQDYVTSNVAGSPDENTKATTGRAGLMYELPFGLTPYVTYAQSFNPIFGSGVCVGGLPAAARRDGGARLQVQSDRRHCDQRRDLRHHRKEPAGERSRRLAVLDPDRQGADSRRRARGDHPRDAGPRPDRRLFLPQCHAWKAATMPASMSKPCPNIRPRCGRSTV